MARIDAMARGSGHPPMPESIMHTIHTLRTAVMGRFGKWDADEEIRVRKILDQTLESLPAE